MTAAPVAIVRIISITDTRDFEEIADGVWKPIPGSGDTHECARCGRLHEVHAEVELADGARAVVGTGCASAENVELVRRFRSGATAATRLRRLRAERSRAAALTERLLNVRAEVAALPLPEISVRPHPTDDRRISIHMGDATVWSFSHSVTAERRECVTASWRERREVERGITSAHRCAERTMAQLDEEIAKVEARLRMLVDGA